MRADKTDASFGANIHSGLIIQFASWISQQTPRQALCGDLRPHDKGQSMTAICGQQQTGGN